MHRPSASLHRFILERQLRRRGRPAVFHVIPGWTCQCLPATCGKTHKRRDRLPVRAPLRHLATASLSSGGPHCETKNCRKQLVGVTVWPCPCPPLIASDQPRTSLTLLFLNLEYQAILPAQGPMPA